MLDRHLFQIHIMADPVYEGETKFVNKFEREKGGLEIIKIFTGKPVKAPEKISFTVTGPDGFSKTVLYSEFIDGKYVFKDIEPGTYKVVEKNADNKRQKCSQEVAML